MPAQGDAQIAGLNATKDQAFDSILAGARSRGLGFSGIPLADQARYTATDFLPAIARVRQSGNDAQTSLTEALNNVNLDQRKTATGILQGELTADEQRRQFEAAQLAARQAAAEAEARADARAAKAGGGGAGGFGLVGGGGGGAPANRVNAGALPAVKPQDQQLYNQMFVKAGGGRWGDRELVSDYNATIQNARRGNLRDRQKVAFYHQFRPDIFGSSIPSVVLANANQVKF